VLSSDRRERVRELTETGDHVHIKPHLHSARFRGSEQGTGHGSGQHEYANTSLALIMPLALSLAAATVRSGKLGSASSRLTDSVILAHINRAM
jgi:hypothetical protein